MNSPTKAAARSPYTRTTMPRWRCRVGSPAPCEEAACERLVGDPHEDQRRRPAARGQQRHRRLVADPRAHLRLEVQPAALAREAVERTVAQAAQRRKLAHDLTRPLPLLAAGLHACVHVEQRIGRHEPHRAVSRLVAAGSLDQRRDHQHRADQHDGECDAVERQPRAQAAHGVVFACSAALRTRARRPAAAALAIDEVDHERHSLEVVALAQAVLDEEPVVAHDQPAIVDVEAKARRAGLDLGRIEDPQSLAAHGRRRALGLDLRDEPVQVGRRDPGAGPVGQRDGLDHQARDVTARSAPRR